MAENPKDSENSSRAIPFITGTNRLSLIIPPTKAKKLRAAPKKAATKRGVGTLKNFVELPLDVIYEVISYLEPLDLLTLGRLSKDFRALFMSRTSLAIWRRVLKGVEQLPPCPEDLNEPQYASLMYDKFCMACGSNRGAIDVDFKIRMRLCATCAKANVVSGYDFEAIYGGIAVRAFPLVPGSYPETLDDDEIYDSKDNDLGLSYFKPEMEMMIRALLSLPGLKAKALTEGSANFIKEQQHNATRMMNEGWAMSNWRDQMECKKQKDIAATVDRRANRIKDEMKALGWEEKYFPKWNDEGDSELWEEFMYQAKEFTTRGWNMIRPKMEVIYGRCKRFRQVEALVERTGIRYMAYRAEQPEEKRKTMPGWGDVYMQPHVLLFFFENYGDCSHDEMEDLMEEIVERSRNFLPSVKTDLIGTIRKCEAKQPDNLATLDKAANLYLCNCSPCLVGRWGYKTVRSYPNIVEHLIIDSHPMRGWDKIAKPTSDVSLIQTARDVLHALGLSEECTRDEVLVLGDLVCRCGHHNYQGRLSFDKLVDHVYYEQRWTRSFQNDVFPDSKHLAEELILDRHSRSGLAELVGVTIPPSAPAAEDDSEAASNESNSNPSSSSSQQTQVLATVPAPGSLIYSRGTDIPWGMYCSYCYQLTLETRSMQNETGNYHMKYKHGKERVANDFDTRDNLITRYGELPENDFLMF